MPPALDRRRGIERGADALVAVERDGARVCGSGQAGRHAALGAAALGEVGGDEEIEDGGSVGDRRIADHRPSMRRSRCAHGAARGPAPPAPAAQTDAGAGGGWSCGIFPGSGGAAGSTSGSARNALRVAATSRRSVSSSPARKSRVSGKVPGAGPTPGDAGLDGALAGGGLRREAARSSPRAVYLAIRYVATLPSTGAANPSMVAANAFASSAASVGGRHARNAWTRS